MYNEKVMKVFANPKNVGEVENYDAIGTVGNATCGDIMQITLKIDNDVITDAKFKTFGCAAAIVLDGDGDDQGQDARRGAQNHQQTGGGRAGRTAPAEAALLGAGGRGDQSGHRRLQKKTGRVNLF